MTRTRLPVAPARGRRADRVGGGTRGRRHVQPHTVPPADSLGRWPPRRPAHRTPPSSRSTSTRRATRQIAGDQFTTVTPGNEMKWQLVEPTQGTYDWSGGDQLVSFAQQHDQLVRGHTLLWHNQFRLADHGVANGTISNDQLRDLLHKHITDEVTHFKGKIWQWDVANEFFANAWDPHPLADGINGDDFWVSAPGRGHRRRRVPLGPPGRPARAAVLQRLQHRRRGRHQRQGRRRVRLGASSCARRACRSTASATRGTWTRSTASRLSCSRICSATPAWV